MNFDPLLSEPTIVQIHAFSALSALVLGSIQFVAPKGTVPHRLFGWIWVALIMAVALSAFWIHGIKIWGIWSPIHVLAIFTLAMVPQAVFAARKHNVRRHRVAMVMIFCFALVGAGLFTLLPDRVMHSVVFARPWSSP